MYCRFCGDSVSELNILDIFMITSIIGGVVYGISAAFSADKKKNQKEKPTAHQKPIAIKESATQKSTTTRCPDRRIQDARVYSQFEEMGSPQPLQEIQNTQVYRESVTEEFASESQVLSKTGAMANGIVSIFEKYSSVILFDVETSGLSPYKDQIIELAAQRLYQKPDGLYAKEFHFYVNLYDGHQISREAEAANHISAAFLREKGVSVESAISKFKDFIGDSALLVAHNANFDMLFVSTAALKADCQSFFQSSDVIDTLTVFKDRAPYPHKLSDAIRYYKLEGTVKNSHSAIDDANALMEVFIRMAAEKDDLLQYVNLFGYNPKYPPEYRLKNVKYFSQPYESHTTALNYRFTPEKPPLATNAVCNESPTSLCNKRNTDNKTTASQNTQDPRNPLSDEKIICEVSVYQTFLRGVEYAQAQRVKNIQFNKKRGLFKANTIGSQIYNTGIQITEQGDIVGYFCNCEAYKNYQWDLFLPLSQNDEYNFKTLHLPITDGQEEFDHLVLSLVKTMIDSLNEKEIVKQFKNPTDLKGGISKLEYWLSELNFPDYQQQIKFLRNLQELRSTGTGHRKGKGHEKAAGVFGLNTDNYVDVFDRILLQANAFILFLAKNFLKDWTVTLS